MLYRLVMGQEANGPSILSLTYSIGLLVGVIVFFNHAAQKRIPTVYRLGRPLDKVYSDLGR